MPRKAITTAIPRSMQDKNIQVPKGRPRKVVSTVTQFTQDKDIQTPKGSKMSVKQFSIEMNRLKKVLSSLSFKHGTYKLPEYESCAFCLRQKPPIACYPGTDGYKCRVCNDHSVSCTWIINLQRRLMCNDMGISGTEFDWHYSVYFKTDPLRAIRQTGPGILKTQDLFKRRFLNDTQGTLYYPSIPLLEYADPPSAPSSPREGSSRSDQTSPSPRPMRKREERDLNLLSLRCLKSRPSRSNSGSGSDSDSNSERRSDYSPPPSRSQSPERSSSSPVLLTAPSQWTHQSQPPTPYVSMPRASHATSPGSHSPSSQLLNQTKTADKRRISQLELTRDRIEIEIVDAPEAQMRDEPEKNGPQRKKRRLGRLQRQIEVLTENADPLRARSEPNSHSSSSESGEAENKGELGKLAAHHMIRTGVLPSSESDRHAVFGYFQRTIGELLAFKQASEACIREVEHVDIPAIKAKTLELKYQISETHRRIQDQETLKSLHEIRYAFQKFYTQAHLAIMTNQYLVSVGKKPVFTSSIEVLKELAADLRGHMIFTSNQPKRPLPPPRISPYSTNVSQQESPRSHLCLDPDISNSHDEKSDMESHASESEDESFDLPAKIIRMMNCVREMDPETIDLNRELLSFEKEEIEAKRQRDLLAADLLRSKQQLSSYIEQFGKEPSEQETFDAQAEYTTILRLLNQGKEALKACIPPADETSEQTTTNFNQHDKTLERSLSEFNKTIRDSQFLTLESYTAHQFQGLYGTNK